MNYIVNQKFLRGDPVAIARFNEKTDAILFIENKIKQDTALKLPVIYDLNLGPDIIQTFSSENTEPQSSGRSSGQSFQPTPFNTAPRPPGTPHNWNKDDEDDNKR